MNNPHISQTELLKLASNKSSISVRSLGQWVKNQTDKEYIIINRNFLIKAIEYIKKNRHTDHFLGLILKKNGILRS